MIILFSVREFVAWARHAAGTEMGQHSTERMYVFQSNIMYVQYISMCQDRGSDLEIYIPMSIESSDGHKTIDLGKLIIKSLSG